MSTPHPDPELLALAALPAEPTDLGVAGHLQTCRQCRTHLDALRRTVDLARCDGVGATLPAPPPRVWQRIADDLAADQDETASAHAAPKGDTEAVDGADGGRGADGASRRGRPPRRVRTGLAAAAAGIALLAGLGIGLGLGPEPAPGPAPEPAPVAQLGPVGFADPAATGTAAMVDENGDQKMIVELRGVTDLAGGDYLEAWLMDATGTRLLPLGALARHGEEFRGEFTVPANLPAGEFVRVDVSVERFDGDPGHSTVSLLRGDLA